MKKGTIRRVLEVLTTANSSGSDATKLSDNENLHFLNDLSSDAFQSCKVFFKFKSHCTSLAVEDAVCNNTF